MAISSLAYLGVRSDLLGDWQDFASGLLGMQAFDRGGKTLSFRMDDRVQRLVVSDEPGKRLPLSVGKFRINPILKILPRGLNGLVWLLNLGMRPFVIDVLLRTWSFSMIPRAIVLSWSLHRISQKQPLFQGVP